MYFGETPLASGTCFFVMSADGLVLVTNRHNFTGRDNITGKTLHKEWGIPDHAVVTLHGPGEVHYHIDLVDHENSKAPSWVEHPTLGAKADIVALPVKEMANIIGENNSISLDGVSSQGNWHRWDVGSELQVIGYPYSQIGGPFPIWSKGFIASEPDVERCRPAHISHRLQIAPRSVRLSRMGAVQKGRCRYAQGTGLPSERNRELFPWCLLRQIAGRLGPRTGLEAKLHRGTREPCNGSWDSAPNGTTTPSLFRVL